MSSKYSKNVRLKRWRAYLDWVLLLLILFFAFAAIILVPALLTASELERVPYALHSILNADYGVDPFGLKFFQVKSDIIAQVLRDNNQSMHGDGIGNPDLPAKPVGGTLQPSATPAPTEQAISPTAPYDPSSTPGITEQSTPGINVTQQASPTPGSSSKTATPTHSSATRRPTSTTGPGRTPVSPTLTSTNQSPVSTSIVPTRAPTSTTASPTRTSEPTEIPTSTPRPPTRTPEPTDPPPPPTNTPRPPEPPDPYPPPYP